MKTSNREIVQIENFLLRRIKPAEQFLFEAKMIIDRRLRNKVSVQRNTYSVIKMFGRKKLRQEIEAIHLKLFRSPKKIGFQKSVLELFKGQ